MGDIGVKGPDLPEVWTAKQMIQTLVVGGTKSHIFGTIVPSQHPKIAIRREIEDTF